MDHNTLFPVLEMGFSFWDILMKPAICFDCRFWQEINRQKLVKFGVDLEHIINLAKVRILNKSQVH